jgi:hypothetical protein
MTRLGIVLGIISVAVLAVSSTGQSAESDLIDSLFGYKICRGQYALCAASTCTPTGGQITVNVAGGGTASFPEAVCTCPVYKGPAIADVNGGNMQGSCAAPGPSKVWSLYWPKKHIPQAINNWSRKPAESAVGVQLCSASEDVGSSYTNCFSFACTLDSKPINGVKTATCHCPLGEGLDGKPVDSDTPIITPAGQCNSAYCSQHPVGAPYPPAGDAANECLVEPGSGSSLDLR